ncbi:hypothetical protein BHU09_07715 [Tannerella sp. oral taxon 808]|nr:hypothetical protein BHU09_07715 [Tannerella sp. oral taxon 808]
MIDRLLSIFSPERLSALCELLRYHPESPMLFSTGLFFFLFIGFYIGRSSGGLKGRWTIAQGNALGSDGVKKIPHPAIHPPTCP